jgi:hypothetical protein
VPTADGRLERLEPRLAELEAQNRLLEKQWAETEKALVDEKRGMEQATLYAESVFRLIGTLAGLEKLVRALKRDLMAYEKANTDLQNGREVREDATKGKLRLERQEREGMVRKPPSFPVE